MKRKLFFASICFVALAACNNSGEDKEKKADTASHDDHQHPPVTGTVPELPAIPEGAKVLFSNLKDNQTVTSPFTLEMGVENIKVDTANLVVAGSGHHHLLINAEDSLPLGEVIPKDSLHIHFGKAQTKYDLALKPGKYKLTLQFADGLHRSYGSKMAATVNVTVK
jgi:hypothetical protein